MPAGLFARSCAGAATRIGAMNALRPADLAARVVAWHNRHPLARRISSSQVGGIGAVSLPFALPEGRGNGALRPIFDSHWMYGVPAEALGRFASEHGAYPLEQAQHWPWRHVDADLGLSRAADAAGDEGRTARHLLSAIIEVDGRRTRVLVAPRGDLRRAPVFGRRLHDRRRHAAGYSALAAGVLVAVLWTRPGPPAEPSTMVAAAHEAVASSAAVGPAQAASASAPVAHAASASAPASAAEASAVVHAAASAGSPPLIVSTTFTPTDVAPMVQDAQAAGPLVRIRPTLTEDERRQARVAAAALRPSAAASAAVPSGTVYALATAAMSRRDDAEAQQVLMQGLKAQTSTPLPTQLDVMPVGRQWRVVWWPHPQQDEAERLRVEARARGLKLELIAF